MAGMDTHMDWIDGQTEIPPVLLDFIPFGATAQKATTNVIFVFLGLANILPHDE